MAFGILCIIAGTTGFDLALGIVSCLYALGPLYFAFFGKSS